MSDDIKVSIFCLCYNHERYIRKTLDGFVNQKTNFKYEVLIHDDASTDKSAEIIREYEKKYPDIIKPIYQTENQYSKKVRISVLYQYPRAKGKYYAMCEGDDWWTDENKLQKQFDFLETHPEYSACVHAATTTDRDLNKLETVVGPYSCDTDIPVEDMIEGGGGFLATASLFYRRTVRDDLPGYMVKGGYGFGDYQIQILLALRGKVRYFDTFMANYTVNAYGSWTQRTNNEKGIAIYTKTNALLDEVNKYTEYKYNDAVTRTIKRNTFNICRIKGDYKEMLKKEYRAFFNQLGIKSKIGVILRAYCPYIGTIYRKIRNR